MRAPGFSLVGSLFVFAVISVSVSFTVVWMSDAGGRSRDAERMERLRSVAAFLERYYDEHGYYPGGYGDPDCDECANGYIDETPEPELLSVILPYLQGGRLPVDPVNSAPNRFYYDAKHTCGGRPDRAHLYVPSLEVLSGNVRGLCDGWSGEGMGGAVDGTDHTWTIELHR